MPKSGKNFNYKANKTKLKEKQLEHSGLTS